MKIPLEKKRRPPWKPEESDIVDIVSMLPFYHSRAGTRFHIVRFAKAFYWEKKYTHTSISFWCGNTGSIGKGWLQPKVDKKEDVCATCLGRAIGAGIVGDQAINGQAVIFSPRSNRK